MSRLNAMCLAISLVALGTLFVGCSSQEAPDPAPATPPPATAASSEDNAKIEAALAELSPADRQLAETQGICPVTDEPLGSMGVPIKVTVEGRDVLVCCEGCIEELKSNFAKYAAKIEK